MLRYSWVEKDLNNLQSRLVEEGYDIKPVSVKTLARNGEINEKVRLDIASDNLSGSFYPLEGYLHLEDSELTPKDKKLVELCKREYRFPFPRGVPIAIGVGWGVGSLIYFLLRLV